MSRRAGLLALGAVLVVITAVKLAVVFAGADYDGDAYAHAMAGRRMLVEPRDVSVHWVWLPLLHALYAVATAAGAGLRALRVLNVLASSAAPLLLAWLLAAYGTRSPQNEADPRLREASTVPWLAAALLAADPLCLWVGVTGQTEPLFQLFLLAACLACARRAFVTGGALFAAAALTRYEAWPLLPLLFWMALRTEKFWGSGASPDATSPVPPTPLPRATVPPILRPHAVWMLPALAVAAWCALHFRATGEPLQFLRLNREFVHGYLAGVGYPWGRQPIVPLMAVFYVVVVPTWNMLGPVHALALSGLMRGFRELPRGFFLVSAALLAIVTMGFLRGTHLGLPRHAVAIAPLFCALVAVGSEALAGAAARRFPRALGRRAPAVFALGVLALVLTTRTLPKTIELWTVTRRAYVEQATAARALRELATPRETIFCDDGKIEVLSELSPERFVRWQIPDLAPSHIAHAARETGSALVLSTPARAAHLPGGRPLWSDGDLVLLRFDAVP